MYRACVLIAGTLAGLYFFGEAEDLAGARGMLLAALALISIAAAFFCFISLLVSLGLYLMERALRRAERRGRVYAGSKPGHKRRSRPEP